MDYNDSQNALNTSANYGKNGLYSPNNTIGSHPLETKSTEDIPTWHKTNSNVGTASIDSGTKLRTILSPTSPYYDSTESRQNIQNISRDNIIHQRTRQHGSIAPRQGENGRNGLCVTTSPRNDPRSQSIINRGLAAAAPKSWGIKLSLNVYFQSENFRAFTALISEYKKSISLMDQTGHRNGSGGVGSAKNTVYQNLQGVISNAAGRVESYPAYKSAREYARTKPYQSFVAATVLAFTLLPVAMFLTFVIGSFCFTFFGFILIEGTLISIATLVMGFVIFWVGSFALCLGIFMLSLYLLAFKIIQFLQRNLPSKARAQRILKSFQPSHLSENYNHPNSNANNPNNHNTDF